MLVHFSFFLIPVHVTAYCILQRLEIMTLHETPVPRKLLSIGMATSQAH